MRTPTFREGHARLTMAGALVLGLFASSEARAATFFVAPAGRDTNPGTLASPFLSFARAQTAAAAGDTVYFRGGTYAFTAGTSACASSMASISGVHVSKSGTPAARINYWAYEGEKPVFDFAGITDRCRIRGFFVTASWIHLRGFEIKGVRQNITGNNESWGVRIEAANNIFERLDVHHIMGAGVFIQSGRGNLVLNCDSHHNHDPLTAAGNGQSGDGFGAHVGAGQPGNVFRGCRAWWNSDDGFDLINAYSPVTIEDSWAWYHGYEPGTMVSLPAGNGNGFKVGGYGVEPGRVNPDTEIKHVVRKCLAVANKAAGFYANHHPDSGTFHNNTGYGNNPSFNMLGRSRADVPLTVGVYRNNLAVGAKLLSNATGADNAFNSWSLPVTVSDADFQSVTLAGLDGPRQPDGSLPALPNFRLAASSDLIDKGQDVMSPFRGAAPDLGAFEYGDPVAAGTGGTAGTGGGGGTRGGSGGSGISTGGTNAPGSGGRAASGGGGVVISTGGKGIGTGGQLDPGGTGGFPSVGAGGNGHPPGLTPPELAEGGCACALGSIGRNADVRGSGGGGHGRANTPVGRRSLLMGVGGLCAGFAFALRRPRRRQPPRR